MTNVAISTCSAELIAKHNCPSRYLEQVKMSKPFLQVLVCNAENPDKKI